MWVSVSVSVCVGEGNSYLSIIVLNYTFHSLHTPHTPLPHSPLPSHSPHFPLLTYHSSPALPTPHASPTLHSSPTLPTPHIPLPTLPTPHIPLLPCTPHSSCFPHTPLLTSLHTPLLTHPHTPLLTHLPTSVAPPPHTPSLIPPQHGVFPPALSSRGPNWPPGPPEILSSLDPSTPSWRGVTIYWS